MINFLEKGSEKELGTLTLLSESILQDHTVNDFSAGDTLPSKETIFFRGKFFVGHYATTFTAFHDSLLS